jgi:rhodanese-related sulfurtransferase
MPAAKRVTTASSTCPGPGTKSRITSTGTATLSDSDQQVWERARRGREIQKPLTSGASGRARRRALAHAGGRSHREHVTGTVAIDALLETARDGLDRVQPEDLAAEAAAGALVVDIRPLEQRERDGELPGAVVIDRNVLEWRLDPTSPNHIVDATGNERRIIIVCNEGYSSTLAAATLQRLGLLRATDLVGGFDAWTRTHRSDSVSRERHRTTPLGDAAGDPEA